MSVDAAGQDLFSILRMFSSKRMGPFENVNAPSPMPPPMQIGGAEADQSQLGGPRPPVAAPPPPPPPPPDAGAADQPAPGAVESIFAGSTAGRPAPEPVSRRVVAPPDAAPAARDAAQPEWMTNNPVWQAWNAQKQKELAEYKREKALDDIIGGIGGMAGALSGDKTLRESGTSLGGTREKPNKYLSLQEIAAFHKSHEEGLKEAEKKRLDALDNARMDEILRDPKMKGVTKEALQSLKHNDEKAYAALLKDYYSQESVTHTDENGNWISVPKHGQADPTVLWTDPVKAAQKQVELEKGKRDLPGGGSSQEELRETARQLGKDPDDPNVMTWLSGMTPNARQSLTTEILKHREQSQAGQRATLAGADIKTAQESAANAETIMIRNAQARRALENGEGIIGGGFTKTELEKKIMEVGGRVWGKDKKEQNETLITATLASNALAMNQILKGPTSDKDMALLQKAAGGDVYMTADEKSRVLALNDLFARRALDAANEKIVLAGKRIGEDRSSEIKQPIARLSDAELREIDPGVLREYLANPETGRRIVEAQYGKSVASELDKRIDDVLDARLDSTPDNVLPGDRIRYTRRRDTQVTKDTMELARATTPADLEARKDDWIKRFDAISPGDGEDTYRLLLAAKQRGHYKEKATP